MKYKEIEELLAVLLELDESDDGLIEFDDNGPIKGKFVGG